MRRRWEAEAKRLLETEAGRSEVPSGVRRSSSRSSLQAAHGSLDALLAQAANASLQLEYMPHAQEADCSRYMPHHFLFAANRFHRPEGEQEATLRQQTRLGPVRLEQLTLEPGSGKWTVGHEHTSPRPPPPPKQAVSPLQTVVQVAGSVGQAWSHGMKSSGKFISAMVAELDRDARSGDAIAPGVQCLGICSRPTQGRIAAQHLQAWNS